MLPSTKISSIPGVFLTHHVEKIESAAIHKTKVSNPSYPPFFQKGRNTPSFFKGGLGRIFYEWLRSLSLPMNAFRQDETNLLVRRVCTRIVRTKEYRFFVRKMRTLRLDHAVA